MNGSFEDSRRQNAIGRGLRLSAALFASMALITACSSSDSSATNDSGAAETTIAVIDESGATSADDVAIEEPVDDQSTEAIGGSGPDGTFLVGDTYFDLEFTFLYEGLVKVPLDTLGKYSEGECFYAVGSVTFLEGPQSAATDRDAFRPSFDPIIGGAVDSEQNDEFFNCDAGAIGDLGYTQTSTTYVEVGSTVGVWLDAIYLAPDQTGTLDGFQIYGDESLVFSAEVTQDISG